MSSEVNTSIDAVLGLILSKIRKHKKISQESAAECIGVTKQAISNMENGRSKFAVVQVYQLCAFYAVEPAKVFGALDEALKSNDVNIVGIGTANLSFAGPNSTLGIVLLSGLALVSPITVGVTLAGFLGAKFMKKLTDVVEDEDVK
jgi:transcriptional regulator with XRE-family HTH domain